MAPNVEIGHPKGHLRTVRNAVLPGSAPSHIGDLRRKGTRWHPQTVFWQICGRADGISTSRLICNASEPPRRGRTVGSRDLATKGTASPPNAMRWPARRPVHQVAQAESGVAFDVRRGRAQRPPLPWYGLCRTERNYLLEYSDSGRRARGSQGSRPGSQSP